MNMKTASKIDVFQRVREINSEASLRKRVMMRAWLLKKTSGVRKSFTYQTSWGTTEEQFYSVFDFAECLKRAWEIEKEIVEEKSRKSDINSTMLLMADTIEAAYRSGINMGD